MTQNKDFAQKAYEKLEMAKRNHELLNLMMAQDTKTGDEAIVLMVGDRPIARILQEPSSLEPNFKKTELVAPMWERASKIDERYSIYDFDQDELTFTAVIDGHLKSVGL